MQKTVRLEIRCHAHEKAVIEKAARLRGVSVAAFILNAIMEKAQTEVAKNMYADMWKCTDYERDY